MIYKVANLSNDLVGNATVFKDREIYIKNIDWDEAETIADALNSFANDDN